MSKCPSCGAENRDNARFCQVCGSALAAPAASPPPSTTLLTPAPEGRPDRRPPARPRARSASGALPAASPTPTVHLPPGADPATAPTESMKAASQAPASGSRGDGAATGQRTGSRPPANADTQTLILPETMALPLDALLDGRRYRIVSLLPSAPGVNSYLVEDRLYRQCSQCQSIATRAGQPACAECGAPFSGDAGLRPRFLLRETFDRDLLAAELKVAELGLRHKGLANAYRSFTERPYGKTQRTYLVSDPPEGSALNALPRPQAEPQVLAWGQQLAEALDYLQSRNVVFHGRLLPEDIRLVNGQARLANLARSHYVKPAGPELFGEDTAALAGLLRDWLGKNASAPTTAVLRKALAAPGYPNARALAADLAAAQAGLAGAHDLTLVVGSTSDVGRQRDHNEDSVLTLDIKRVQLSAGKPVGLYAVADGMGGQAAGEVASELVINTLMRTLVDRLAARSRPEAGPGEPDYQALLKEASQEAARAVYDLGQQAHNNMGSTLVAALVVGSRAFVANIGDSRAYWLSADRMEQITTDHSVVDRLVALGQLTREQARVHPQRNVIYRTIGDKREVEPDLFPVVLQEGEGLLLCSDGLHGLVEDATIYQTVRAYRDPQAACQKLTELANAAGGDDNISVIIVKLQRAADGG